LIKVIIAICILDCKSFSDILSADLSAFLSASQSFADSLAEDWLSSAVKILPFSLPNYRGTTIA